MTTVKRFKDLHCWQSARQLVNMIYEVTNGPQFSRDFALRDQIRRAVVSVMSNIAEGFNAGSDSEFIRFLGFSRRSISETQSQSYIALDQKYINRDLFDDIYAKANQTEKQVIALISYLDRSRRGLKEDQGIYSADLQDLSDPSDL